MCIVVFDVCVCVMFDSVDMCVGVCGFVVVLLIFYINL